jgi:chromate reductase
MNSPRDVVVIVGSLRKESFNRKMAKAIAALAPPTLKLEIVEIGQLPLYNQDLEASPTAEVTAFKERVARADAVLFVTPNTTAACLAS